MIPDHAQTLYSSFEREGIRLLLAGGWAVCFHGYARFTRDVDWVCSRENERKAGELMARLGLSKFTDGMASRFVMVKDPSFPPVDLIWVDDETFGKMAASENRTGRHGDIPVIDFESLLAMKLHALKDDAHRQGRDMLDIRSLLKYSPTRISEERLRELCLRFAGPGVYEQQIEPYR
jgi:hypothetical protein